MNIAMILQSEFPGAEWYLVGEDYSGLNWMDSTPKPTEAELKKLSKKVETSFADSEKDFLKRSAYQEESDPLFFKWQAGEVTEKEWLDSRAAIKKRFA